LCLKFGSITPTCILTLVEPGCIFTGGRQPCPPLLHLLIRRIVIFFGRYWRLVHSSFERCECHLPNSNGVSCGCRRPTKHHGRNRFHERLGCIDSVATRNSSNIYFLRYSPTSKASHPFSCHLRGDVGGVQCALTDDLGGSIWARTLCFGEWISLLYSRMWRVYGNTCWRTTHSEC
jgi:hypothetical protein